jgi:hypothetical protein
LALPRLLKPGRLCWISRCKLALRLHPSLFSLSSTQRYRPDNFRADSCARRTEIDPPPTDRPPTIASNERRRVGASLDSSAERPQLGRFALGYLSKLSGTRIASGRLRHQPILWSERAISFFL